MVTAKRTHAAIETDESKFWDKSWASGEDNSGSFTLRLLPFHKLRGKKVLEIGCGAMVCSPAIVEKMDVTGLDISSVALRIASEKKIKTVSNLLRADARHLPFRDNSFDVVMAAEILPLLNTSVFKTLEEMARVSRRTLIFTLTDSDVATEYFKARGVHWKRRSSLNVIGHGSEGPDFIAISERTLHRTLERLDLKPVRIARFSNDEIVQLCEPYHQVPIRPEAPKLRLYVEARKR